MSGGGCARSLKPLAASGTGLRQGKETEARGISVILVGQDLWLTVGRDVWVEVSGLRLLGCWSSLAVPIVERFFLVGGFFFLLLLSSKSNAAK